MNVIDIIALIGVAVIGLAVLGMLALDLWLMWQEWVLWPREQQRDQEKGT